MSHCARRLSRGFTLVELLVVLAILAMLAGLVGPQVLNQLGGAKSKTAVVQIRDLEQALEMYKLDLGRFPASDAGLEALVREPPGAKGWNGPYLRGTSIPKDPWGNSFNYRFPGQNTAYDLFSYGADAAPGGSGEDADVKNWE